MKLRRGLVPVSLFLILMHVFLTSHAFIPIGTVARAKLIFSSDIFMFPKSRLYYKSREEDDKIKVGVDVVPPLAFLDAKYSDIFRVKKARRGSSLFRILRNPLVGRAFAGEAIPKQTSGNDLIMPRSPEIAVESQLDVECETEAGRSNAPVIAPSERASSSSRTEEDLYDDVDNIASISVKSGGVIDHTQSETSENKEVLAIPSSELDHLEKNHDTEHGEHRLSKRERNILDAVGTAFGSCKDGIYGTIDILSDVKSDDDEGPNITQRADSSLFRSSSESLRNCDETVQESRSDKSVPSDGGSIEEETPVNPMHVLFPAPQANTPTLSEQSGRVVKAATEAVARWTTFVGRNAFIMLVAITRQSLKFFAGSTKDSSSKNISAQGRSNANDYIAEATEYSFTTGIDISIDADLDKKVEDALKLAEEALTNFNHALQDDVSSTLNPHPPAPPSSLEALHALDCTLKIECEDNIQMPPDTLLAVEDSDVSLPKTIKIGAVPYSRLTSMSVHDAIKRARFAAQSAFTEASGLQKMLQEMAQ